MNKMKNYLKILWVGTLLILGTLVPVALIWGLTYFWMWVFKPLDVFETRTLYATLVTICGLFSLLIISSPFIYLIQRQITKPKNGGK
jgi:hypothetical protein